MSNKGSFWFLVVVLLGILAWQSGLLDRLVDPAAVPTPTVTQDTAVPVVIPTSAPVLTQPEYVPQATSQPQNTEIVGEIQRLVDELKACVDKQFGDPFNNYHCEVYRDALENLRQIGVQQ